MSDKQWYAALSGLAFVVVVIVGFIIAGESPDPTEDPIQEVIDFYKDDDTAQWIGVALEAIAASLLVLFGAYLRHVLRAAEILSWVVFAGIIIIAIGLAIDATITVALIDAVDGED